MSSEHTVTGGKPMARRFAEKLAAAQRTTGSVLAVGLVPVLGEIPLSLTRHDEPYLPYGKAVIDVTAGAVCAYVFHLGAYLGLGAAGAIALERTIAYVPDGIVRVLHGPFAGPDYVRAAFDDAFNADAVTLAANISEGDLAAYVGAGVGFGAFVQATDDADEVRIRHLARRWPGQVGSYRASGLQHNCFTLHVDGDGDAVDATDATEKHSISIQWHWGSRIFRVRDETYASAWREAVRVLNAAQGQSAP